MDKESLERELSRCVLEYDEASIVPAARTYVEAGYPALDGVMLGLVKGMEAAGKLFEEDEYFVTDLLLCGDAMMAAMDILSPHLPKETGMRRAKCVIGVIRGDTHDIGKNLVKTMLETAGFEMIDLGRDVPPEAFVETAKREGAQIIALSTLMTTTMRGMEEVIALLEQEGMRDRVKVLIGGGPVSQHYCEQIGADGYSANAIEAVALAKRVTE